MQAATAASNEEPGAGLTSAEARTRLARIGANEIAKAAPRSTWAAVFDQFRSPLVLLLLAASTVSTALELGELADTMRQPPRPVDEPILGRREWKNVLGTGALQAVIALAVFVWALESRSLEEARNLAFSMFVFSELLRAFASRDLDLPFWRIDLFTNLQLLGIVAISVLVQLGIHHIPATQAFFEIGELRLSNCVLSLLLGLFALGVLETLKISRSRSRVTPRQGGTAQATHAAPPGSSP